MSNSNQNQRNFASFNKDTTTDQVLAGLDLQNKLYVVTGASGGLGEETARALAVHGARVIITARDLKKAAAVVDKIKQQKADAVVEVEELELASFKSIRAAAKRILAKHPHIDGGLILNAGVMACPQGKTENGFETQFGTNHLGHFLFTNLLVPALTNNARIVSVSSFGHRFGPVDFDDVNFERRTYDAWKSYGQAKTANILFAVELDRVLKQRGIRAYALHPGGIQTELDRHLRGTDAFAAFFEVAKKEGFAIEFKSIPAGAATQTLAATAPELQNVGGVFLNDCQVTTVALGDDASPFKEPHAHRAYALDAENAKKLWKLSETLVGEHFTF